ncbi:MAG TPA: ATP-binding protein, partial [Membranihabitans sp.]|nr:ATP-binding protein [Membranihabitans sp.]
REDEAREIVRHVSKVIIEQIDNLSRIASEFSSFANLPKPEYEEIMLNDLVASVYDLFRTRSNIKFNLYVPIDELMVQADRTHLIRVMNNLMKNAVQAIPPDREGHIVIRLLEKDGLAVVRVEDNGKGIEDDLHEKVFFPNFTTKSSGTGLGLAISKNIIETFDGAIYFIKNKPEGTIFIFELPLVN